MATAFRPDKPQPIFADRILQQDVKSDRLSAAMSGKKLWPDVKNKIRSAQKFVLTEDAMWRIVSAMDAFPEQLVYNAKFALAPHPTTWLEVAPDHKGASFNTAYLVHEGTFYAITTYGALQDSFLVLPFVIDLNVPPTREELKATLGFFGFTPEELDKAFWGRLYDAIPERLRGRMKKQHRIRFLNEDLQTLTDLRETKEQLDIHVRMLLATFLAFNQPKTVLNVTAHEAQRRMTAKGPKRYFAHNVVTIQLGKTADIRFNYRVPGGSHAPPRWHEVMGHWMHFGTEQGKHCTHGYGQDPDWWERFYKDEEDGHIRYQCRQCGSKRVWREYPEGRGDGGKGMSLHHHVVQG